jgi:exodeoxyribonuclease VII small subunit
MSDSKPAETPPAFEASLEQLQSIVDELEEGRLGLEASLGRFEEGVRLLRTCYGILEKAEQRIEILTGADAEGNPITAPFDATATVDGGIEGAKKPGRRRAPAKAAVPLESESRQPDPNDQRLF